MVKKYPQNAQRIRNGREELATNFPCKPCGKPSAPCLQGGGR